jgi:hypothetical protein
MGFKSAILILAVLSCLAFHVMAEDTNNNSPIADEIKKSFQNEDLFNISPSTGMSSNATAHLTKTSGLVVVRTAALASGFWSLNLKDTTSSTMRLNLSQYQDAVFGSGDITIASTVTPVTAGGTMQGDRLNLYVVPEGSASLYRMSLTVLPGSMNGNYVLTAPGLTQPGIVFGSLTAPLQTGATTVYSQPVQPRIMPLGPKNLN